MAPSRPSARTLRTQRLTGQIHPLLPPKIYRPDAHVTDAFLSTKQDKRLIKHSSFLSRITSSSSSSSKITKSSKPHRGRRPKNKLKTSLGALADALPDVPRGKGGEAVLGGKIKHKSLPSKKGALKRKDRVVRGEMERFGVSMAALTAAAGRGTATSVSAQTEEGGGVGTHNGHGHEDGEGVAARNESAASGATAHRWAALRGYISSTMDQNPAFAAR